MTSVEIEIEQDKSAILRQVAARAAATRVAESVADEERINAFLQHYFRHVDAQDICRRSPDELLGIIASHFRLARQRADARANLRVFVPGDDDGFGADGHTVIMIVTDDEPYLIDSLTMEVTGQGWEIADIFHPQFMVMRDAAGELRDIVSRHSDDAAHAVRESWIYMEVVGRLGADAVAGHPALEAGLRSVLRDVEEVVEDWDRMRERAVECAATVAADRDDRLDERETTAELLRWLADDHFTFLGYCEYTVAGSEYTPVAGSGLGLLRSDQAAEQNFHAVGEPNPSILVFTKASERSTIHRPVYLDYIGIRDIADGEVVRERRFLGLLSSIAYSESVFNIPLLRRKAAAIAERAGFDPESHGGRALAQAIDAYPRDEFMQASVDELAPVLEQISRLRERRQVRLFIRRGRYGRFLSCLVFLPRDRYTTKVREALQRTLLQYLGAESLEYQAHVSESLLARLSFVVKMPAGQELPHDIDIVELERRLTAAIRDWEDGFIEEVGSMDVAARGIEFPGAYTEDFTPAQGVLDLRRLNELTPDHTLGFALYRPDQAGDPAHLRLKMFAKGRDVTLSRVLPLLTLLGVTVIDERPYEIELRGEQMMIYDFGLAIPGGPDAIATDWRPADRERFMAAFEASYRGHCEADGLNALVMSAGLTWREVSWLRAIARYLQQAGLSSSQAYVAQALVDNAELARALVELFAAKYDPAADPATRGSTTQAAHEAVLAGLDAVASLDQDKIIRSFVAVIDACVRTNAYVDGATAVALKLVPAVLDMLPDPKPATEIWVYAPRVEGVHLRFGKVARGGLRWSDRREDFRLEVLGLANAQMFKNTVIVPVGAKGGFYPKNLPNPAAGRGPWLDEGVACYQIFIDNLLSVTDNIVAGAVVGPEKVVRYDEDDPYLVVAADKGTATFSDIANAISIKRGFWLGDAFASGGSIGYDHKAMGITARGAWESVKRHFYEMGIDCQNEDFTCVGIGDMSGDVFGNGMLRSRHTKLVAAFNHLDIFLDPDPEPDEAFRERERLFGIRGSSWRDYEPTSISEGGGVYPRTAKSIPITWQVRDALGIDESVKAMPPAELISAILAAPVDLLYNGGIGTYVKASTETNAQVGDRANDAVRIDGRDVRARCVGEGGNLGWTQLARVEYASNGGRIAADFIDNSAGVDTSDHEVNIKILLAMEIAAGRMTLAERDELLPTMTDEVAALVLAHNIEQGRALMNSANRAAQFAGIHEEWMKQLDASGLDRRVQFMPSTAEMERRMAEHAGLTSPELCSLLAATKIKLYDDVLASDLPEDPYLADRLIQYFPKPLRERYRDLMPAHRLHREIISTVAVNRFVDSQGITAFHRLSTETGSDVADVIRAQLASRAIFNAGLHETQMWNAEPVTARVETHIRMALRLLVEKGSRWLLHNRRHPLDVAAAIQQFGTGVQQLKDSFEQVIAGRARAGFEARNERLLEQGVEPRVARVVAMEPELSQALSIVQTAQQSRQPVELVGATYFALAQRLGLDLLLEHAEALPRMTRWDTMSRAALREDLLMAHAQLTREALEAATGAATAEEAVEAWAAASRDAERSAKLLTEVCDAPPELARISVALRAVRSLLKTPA